ncbi:MAG: AI-2E family transporter [Desulfovibrionaceae bacterium]|nr:AI-2E family transporter [Desulfovibrionaceae bacterium]
MSGQPQSGPSLFLPRVMYFIAGVVWILLLWPMPNTVFLAGCFACLAYPLYLKLRRYARRGRRRLERRKAELEAEAAASGRRETRVLPLIGRRHTLPAGTRFSLAFRTGWFRALPMLGTFSAIFLSVAIPVALFVVMVTPQIASGFARMRELWMHNFELPDELAQRIDGLVEKIQTIPGLDKVARDIESYQETLAGYLSNFSTDTLVKWANQGFDLLGGASSVAIHFVLFLGLAFIFIIYAPRIRLISARLLHLNPLILHRFTLSIRSALRAILMGVVFVAIIQGFLCAIGFALVGVSQFAFWGLVAAILAPIPMFGTALVWAPLALHLWATGHPMAALALVVWCVAIVSSADSVLRPIFLKTGIKASFMVLILVIFCGIAAFGTIGIILGPVLLALSIQAMEEGNLAYPSMLQPLAARSNSNIRRHDSLE